MFKDYSISIFPQFPKKGEKTVYAHEKYLFITWEEVKNYLFEQSKIVTDDKLKNFHVISGTTLDNRKLSESFNKTSCVYFQDIDDTRGLTSKEFVEKFKHLNHNYLMYYSASYTKEKPRFRMVFNLNRPIIKQEFIHFWTNFCKLYDNLFDVQSNYLSKSNALPRTFLGTRNFFGEVEGEPVSIEAVKDAFVYKPPEKSIELPDDYHKYKLKKTSMNGNLVSWRGLHDCPFANTKNVISRIRSYQSIMGMDGMGRFNGFKSIIGSLIGTAKAMEYQPTESEILGLLQEIDGNQLRRKQKSHIDSVRKLLRG